MKLKRILSALLVVVLVAFSFSACAILNKMPVNNGESKIVSQENENESNNGTEASGNELLKVYYLDVGQGDSEFIVFPNGKTMLIDAGEKDEGAKVCETIKELGFSKIDYVVATHPHADHIGGLPEVFNQFEVETVYMPSGVSSSKTYERLLDAIEAEDCAVMRAMDGVTVINEGNLKAQFVAPVNEDYENLNNYSAVLKVDYFENSFLFMGDAEKQSELEITADVKADVIKVGHHGSSTASTEEFIKKVKPTYAVIEVGADNSYGHPHDEVIDLYSKMNTKIFTTSENGDIFIESDGKIISFVTEK